MQKSSSTYRAGPPGAGFVCLVMTVLFAVGTVAWGLRTPPLDHVWRMQLELRLGDRPLLSVGERDLLQETLARYPLLGEHFLGDTDATLISLNVSGVVDAGGAYAVRRAADVDIDVVVTSPTGEPLAVEVGSSTETASGTADGRPFVWQPPASGPFPQLIEIRLLSADQADPLPMAIQLVSRVRTQ